jgi:serine/threonine protein kinase
MSPHDGDERNPVEILAEEFLERCRKGETPEIDEYTDSHPEFEDEIRALFPTMLAMERLKLSRESSRGGHATLGPHKLERLGDFELVRELGRGGMGVVFEAEQKSLGRRVAVKVLPRQQLMHERQLTRFEREARMAAGLHHTNIVPIFGTGEQDGFHYYVMQFISGLGLDDVIRELRKGGQEENPLLAPLMHEGDGKQALANAVARLGLQAARALEHAHEQNVLHRDIKPANLLLDAHGTLWITDFGLAKALEEVEVTRSGDVVGTLAYMAPEQFKGSYTERTDIYSLGLTLYELMTLHPAYPERDRTQLIHAISTREPEHPRKYGLELPEDLVTIVLKCVARDPGHRYSDATQLCEDLEAFLEGRPISARPVSVFERSRRWAARNPAMAALSASTIVLLLVALIGGWVAFVQTNNALSGQREETARAEANLNLTLEALSDIFGSIGGTMAQVAPVQRSDEDSDASSLLSETITEPLAQPTVSKSEAKMLARMLEMYERLAEANRDSRRVQGERAHAYRSIGDIQQRLLDWDAALQAYGRAQDLYVELEGIPELERITIQAAIFNEMGRVHAVRDETGKALEAHQRAFELLEPLTERSDSPALRYEYVRTINFRSEGYARRHRLRFLTPKDYQRWRGWADRILARQGAENASGRINRRFAELRKRIERMLAEVQEASKVIAKARRYVELLLRLAPKNDAYRLVGAKCYQASALLSAYSNDFAGAGKQLGQSLALFEELVQEHPDVDHYRFEWAEALVRSAGMHDSQEEILQIQKGVAQHNEIASKPGARPLYRAARARALSTLAQEQSRFGDDAGAEASSRAALVHWDELAGQMPEVLAYRQALHAALRQLASIQSEREDTAKAIELMRATIRSREIAPWSEGVEVTPFDEAMRSERIRDVQLYARLLESVGMSSEADAERERALLLIEPGQRRDFARMWLFGRQRDR